MHIKEVQTKFIVPFFKISKSSCGVVYILFFWPLFLWDHAVRAGSNATHPSPQITPARNWASPPIATCQQPPPPQRERRVKLPRQQISQGLWKHCRGTRLFRDGRLVLVRDNSSSASTESDKDGKKQEISRAYRCGAGNEAQVWPVWFQRLLRLD